MNLTRLARLLAVVPTAALQRAALANATQDALSAEVATRAAKDVTTLAPSTILAPKEAVVLGRAEVAIATQAVLTADAGTRAAKDVPIVAKWSVTIPGASLSRLPVQGRAVTRAAYSETVVLGRAALAIAMMAVLTADPGTRVAKDVPIVAKMV